MQIYDELKNTPQFLQGEFGSWNLSKQNIKFIRMYTCSEIPNFVTKYVLKPQTFMTYSNIVCVIQVCVKTNLINMVIYIS